MESTRKAVGVPAASGPGRALSAATVGRPSRLATMTEPAGSGAGWACGDACWMSGACPLPPRPARTANRAAGSGCPPTATMLAVAALPGTGGAAAMTTVIRAPGGRFDAVNAATRPPAVSITVAPASVLPTTTASKDCPAGSRAIASGSVAGAAGRVCAASAAARRMPGAIESAGRGAAVAVCDGAGDLPVSAVAGAAVPPALALPLAGGAGWGCGADCPAALLCPCVVAGWAGGWGCDCVDGGDDGCGWPGGADGAWAGLPALPPCGWDWPPDGCGWVDGGGRGPPGAPGPPTSLIVRGSASPPLPRRPLPPDKTDTW